MPSSAVQSDPIRLPAWATAALVTFLPVLIAVILEADWRAALAAGLGGLIPGAGIIGYATSKDAQERQEWELAVLVNEADQAAADEAWAKYEQNADDEG